MVSKVVFKKIKFNNIESKNFDKYIIKKGLFVFPAGPALAKIEESFEYQEAAILEDLLFTLLGVTQTNYIGIDPEEGLFRLYCSSDNIAPWHGTNGKNSSYNLHNDTTRSRTHIQYV